MKDWRKTEQYLLPVYQQDLPVEQYNIYPSFPLAERQVAQGFEALAEQLIDHQHVLIDGYGGVFWEAFRSHLQAALAKLGHDPEWLDIKQAMKAEADIDAMLAPYLGGDDPLFGRLFDGELECFFDAEKLQSLQADEASTIAYGCGAALLPWEDALLVYLDVPKNEIQYRSRAGTIHNLGASESFNPKVMYKRFFFADWPALNRHKASLLPRIDIFVDEQRRDEITFISGQHLRAALKRMSESSFRVRPWFEAGPWGGHWLRAHIPSLPQDVPNYAWSFELITPENGLIFASDGLLLECSFDLLMFQAHEQVLGYSAERFGFDFPIRFNFLDTVGGGNLSVQCHPSPAFMRREFGLPFTQDETYYIVDCQEGAQVTIGFQEGVDAAELRQVLLDSQREAQALDSDAYFYSARSHKHDLFLIPHGTVHSSGQGNMVLEISATPYIFTFKMYDWMRLGLDGKPRPLNIERAFANLDFKRQGERIQQELVAEPAVIEQGEDWQLLHLKTHAQHFYDVYRYEFDREVKIATRGSVQVLSLVEGSSLRVLTSSGLEQRYNYIESFVIPAAAETYTLINEAQERAKVIVAWMKPDAV